MAVGVFLGLTTVDILNYVDSYPGSNEKVRAKEQLVYAGGPAANAAVAFAGLSNSAHLYTGLGTHPLAELAKADLELHGVNVSDAAFDPELLPVLSSIIVEERSGDRSVVYTNTEERMLAGVMEPDIVLENCSVLMLDGYFLPQAALLARQAKLAGIPVVLDGGSWKDGLEQLLPHVDYAICSANFSPPGCSCNAELVLFLQSLGIYCIAISQGGNNLLAYEGVDEKEIPVESTKVVDTLGAGDILHGAFCHFILQHGFYQSLKLACEVATGACSSKGTRAWLKNVVS